MTLGLQSREEDYKRLNAQIQAQTAKLVAQAEQVMILGSHALIVGGFVSQGGTISCC